MYNSTNSTIKEKTILYTESLSRALAPKESNSVSLKVSKVLSTQDEIDLNNESEVIKVQKTGGSSLTSTPGNYVPGAGKTEIDDDMAGSVIITPSTGGNKIYIIPVIVGITALIILTAGIIIIKKKVL